MYSHSLGVIRHFNAVVLKDNGSQSKIVMIGTPSLKIYEKYTGSFFARSVHFTAASKLVTKLILYSMLEHVLNTGKWFLALVQFWRFYAKYSDW